MSSDWTHQFCLACDKQTDGATYCSESCRLADFERTSLPNLLPSSPTSTAPTLTWTFSSPPTRRQPLYLPPAYDFSNAQPYGTTPSCNASYFELASFGSSTRAIPSFTSQTSLCSMKSSFSTEAPQLSEKATKELRAYARSFDTARLQRRRSY